MKLQLHETVGAATTLVDFIAERTELSKSSIKKALNFGGGWLQVQGHGSPQRCRRATKQLAAGDRVKFYFDDQLYQQEWPQPQPIHATHHWGVWYKPVNVVAQGTPYGDLGSMEQQVQKLSGAREVFLIHRLDREAAGLMIFAYTRKAAAGLSEIWRDNRVAKIYQAEVLGRMTHTSGTFDEPLDDKAAVTHYELIEHKQTSSLVQVRLQTGRLHQIRRHFAQAGHPLLGDPKYGAGLANDARGLQLVASELRFDCPVTHKPQHILLPAELRLF